jgi:hypothetical protein
MFGTDRCPSSVHPRFGSASRSAANASIEVRAEPQSPECQSVEPQVHSAIEQIAAQKRSTLVDDAVSALDETRHAIAAIEKAVPESALVAIDQASTKLNRIISRDPTMTLAPVSVHTEIIDLYSTPDTVKTLVQQAGENLSSDQVQHARRLLHDLSSEADIQVTELPLATYPAAIRAAPPLIHSGQFDEAKAALCAALHALVTETIVVPLPRVRAVQMLENAQRLAAGQNRTAYQYARINGYLDATMQQLQLAEALGYGGRESFRPLYAQLEQIRRKIAGNESAVDLFDTLHESIRKFSFSI